MMRGKLLLVHMQVGSSTPSSYILVLPDSDTLSSRPNFAITFPIKLPG